MRRRSADTAPERPVDGRHGALAGGGRADRHAALNEGGVSFIEDGSAELGMKKVMADSRLKRSPGARQGRCTGTGAGVSPCFYWTNCSPAGTCRTPIVR